MSTLEAALGLGVVGGRYVRRTEAVDTVYFPRTTTSSPLEVTLELTFADGMGVEHRVKISQRPGKDKVSLILPLSPDVCRHRLQPSRGIEWHGGSATKCTHVDARSTALECTFEYEPRGLLHSHGIRVRAISYELRPGRRQETSPEGFAYWEQRYWKATVAQALATAQIEGGGQWTYSGLLRLAAEPTKCKGRLTERSCDGLEGKHRSRSCNPLDEKPLHDSRSCSLSREALPCSGPCWPSAPKIQEGGAKWAGDIRTEAAHDKDRQRGSKEQSEATARVESTAEEEGVTKAAAYHLEGAEGKRTCTESPEAAAAKTDGESTCTEGSEDTPAPLSRGSSHESSQSDLSAQQRISEAPFGSRSPAMRSSRARWGLHATNSQKVSVCQAPLPCPDVPTPPPSPRSPRSPYVAIPQEAAPGR